MKFIKSISTSIFTLLLCTACESDLEQVTYSSENVNPEKPDVPINKNDAFQKVQKRRVQEKR